MGKLRLRQWWFSLLAAATYALVMLWRAPLSERFMFGGDEGFEFMKGFLAYLGHHLYLDIWNDQPPLHTALLSAWFGLVGPGALAGRVLAVAFSALLVGMVCELARRSSGLFGGLTAGAVLLAWPGWMHLSISVMLEIPAMALGATALLLMRCFHADGSRRFLAFSGVMMGLALQTKLTAAIFLPALGCLLAGSSWRKARDQRTSPFPRAVSDAVLWSLCLAATVLLVKAAYPGQTLETLLLSHFSEGTRAEGGSGFNFRAFISNEFDLALPALLAVGWVLWRRDIAALTPALLLLTAVLVHWVHRPYWFYYAVHFAIPAAWLTGVALHQTLEAILRLPRQRLTQAPFPAGWAIAGWSLVAALLFSSLPGRLKWGFERVTRHSRGISDDAAVSRLEAYAPVTRWIFTDDPIAAFHARLPLPPELAVIPRKRVWSGQLTPEYLVQQLERYQPEQVYLSRQRWDWPELDQYLQNHYAAEPLQGGRWFLRLDLSERESP